MKPRLDDPAWLDAQYNNRVRVADSMVQLAKWAEASALARERSPNKACARQERFFLRGTVLRRRWGDGRRAELRAVSGGER